MVVSGANRAIYRPFLRARATVAGAVAISPNVTLSPAPLGQALVGSLIGIRHAIETLPIKIILQIRIAVFRHRKYQLTTVRLRGN